MPFKVFLNFSLQPQNSQHSDGEIRPEQGFLDTYVLLWTYFISLNLKDAVQKHANGDYFKSGLLE